MTSTKGPTLTDRKGMGGIIAQDGFDYQVWDALRRLPAWLRNPAFEGFAVETLEDVEARFFAPHAPRGHLLDRFQAKSSVLDRGGLIEVFEAFRTFKAAHSDVARIQTLVMPALPAKLNWVARDPERVRRARPFYSPFKDIRATSDDKLRADLVGEFGPELGTLLADEVEIDLWPVSDRATAEARFAAALQEQFPELDASPRKTTAAFKALTDLAQQRGVLLPRGRLLDVLRDSLGTELVVGRHLLPLHVRSDRNGEEPDALEINASDFSGSGSGFPEAERWTSGLLDPLSATAAWASRNGLSRIRLSGSFRLTTAFALGWTFRSATGFEIDIPTRSGLWATDDHTVPGGTPPPWTIKPSTGLIGDRLVVGIGVLQDPTPVICRNLGLPNEDRLLLAKLPQALPDAQSAQASVQTIKAAVVQASARLRPSAVDLCFVGPAALAVALGHRWNALPPTQLFEFVRAEGRYAPTALLALT